MFRSVVFVLAVAVPVSAADPSPAEVFEQRLRPIFNSPKPSSCVQCHLAGVDLKDYILPDAAKTFRSLRDQGLIDLDHPEKSKIVRLIDMGGDRTGPVVHAANRKAEREAFLAWIAACAKDPALRNAPPLPASDAAKPAAPDAVIRHARTDRLLAAFERDVWAWRFRCMNCHTEGTPQNDKLRQKHGDRVAWVKRAGPAATMDYLLASKLIDPTDPERSTLLTKPLGEDHGGGTKFAVGDEAYKGFRSWLADVAAVRAGAYKTPADLPKPTAGPERFGTDIWLKLTDCPPAWGEKLLMVKVVRWDTARGGWEPEPIATSDRLASGKLGLWQHNLTLLAAAGSDRAKGWKAGPPALPAGRYRVDIYVDRDGRLAKDWTADWADADRVGAVEVRSDWKEGYGRMTAASARTVR